MFNRQLTASKPRRDSPLVRPHTNFLRAFLPAKRSARGHNTPPPSPSVCDPEPRSMSAPITGTDDTCSIAGSALSSSNESRNPFLADIQHMSTPPVVVNVADSARYSTPQHGSCASDKDAPLPLSAFPPQLRAVHCKPDSEEKPPYFRGSVAPKMPAFYQDNVRLWLQLVNSFFTCVGITESHLKYQLLINQLPVAVIGRVSNNLLQASDPDPFHTLS